MAGLCRTLDWAWRLPRSNTNGKMKCPECKERTQVLRTDGSRRRRECVNGHRFTTVETVQTGRSSSPMKAVKPTSTKPSKPDVLTNLMHLEKHFYESK